MSSSSPLLPNYLKGQLYVVSAPSGTGKSTLIQMLTKEFPRVVASVTYTTRQPRSNEQEGVDYHFITMDQFIQKKSAGEFLETVELYGVHYGSSIRDVQDKLQQGKIVILVIDTQGMMTLKQKHQQPFISIFIRPPSIENLGERLENRSTESSDTMKQRLDIAEKELEMEKFYDYSILNDELNVAYDVLRSIFIAENHKIIN